MEKKEGQARQAPVFGSSIPPPHGYKADVIRYYAEKNNVSILLETGTYLGQTVESCLSQFRKIISIEIEPKLYRDASNKFSEFPHVSILQGDSGELLPNILSDLDQDIIFWLDGHYSGGITGKGESNTPIMKELEAIFSHNNDHIVLIDDARCFIGEEGYPTIFELRDFVKERRPEYSFMLKHDIIRIGRLSEGVQY